MAISAEDKNFLVSLYVGYFNRAPDPAGLQFWIDQVEAGRDTNTIAADFAASPEAKSLYPFLTTPDVSSPTSFITAVYANLFNRAPDAAGQAFWEAQLSSGAVSPADAIDAIIKGATTAPDATILANKNIVGLDFATDAGNTPGFTFDLDGTSGSAAKDAISGVTEDSATVTAAQAATDAYLSGVANIGQTFTLTDNLDALNGTAAGDSFIGDNATSSAGDQVNGQAGVDTLSLFGTTALPQMSSVENLVLDGINAALSTANRTGIENVTIKNSTFTADRAVTLANGEALTLENHEGAFDVDLSSTKGVETVTLNDVGNATGADVDLDLGPSATDITELTLNGTGASSDVDLEDAQNKLTTLKITGDQNIDVENAAITSLKTYDASAAGVGQSITIGAAVDATITGSTGDDTFNLGGTLTTKDTIDGGEGNDTLQVALATDVAGDLNVKNVEILRMDDANANASIDMDNVAGITTLRVSEGDDNAETVTVTDVASTATTVQFTGDGEDAAQQFDGIVVDYDVTTAIAETKVAISNTVEAKNVTINGITAQLSKAITIDATNVGTAAGEVLATGTITGSSLETVTLNSNSDVNTTVTGTGELKTIDVSGSDAGVTLVVNDVEDEGAITTGDGNDVLTLVNVQGDNVVVTAGSGTDTLTIDGDGATTDLLQIEGFSTGVGGDVLDLDTSAVANTTNANNFLILGNVDNANTEVVNGFTVIDNNDGTNVSAAGLTTAQIAAYLADTDGGGANTDAIILDANNADQYLAVSDGTDTAIIFVDADGDGSADQTIEAGDITILGVLKGVSDAGTLTAANFADFL